MEGTLGCSDKAAATEGNVCATLHADYQLCGIGRHWPVGHCRKCVCMCPGAGGILGAGLRCAGGTCFFLQVAAGRVWGPLVVVCTTSWLFVGGLRQDEVVGGRGSGRWVSPLLHLQAPGNDGCSSWVSARVEVRGAAL